MPDVMTEQVAARPHARPQQLSLLVLGAGVVVAALAVAWLAFQGSPSAAPSANARPTLVSQAQLQRFAASLDHPVYWVGPKPGYSYELTSSRGRVWVRYLPAGVKAGDHRASFLVVGTYALPGAFAGLQRVAKGPTAVSRSIADGGLMLYDAKRPTSTYFSYPGVRYQVEVYAPSSQEGRSLVFDGSVVPVR
jgi:hypothetical protein